MSSFDDDWDSVIGVEGAAFAEGKLQGAEDARTEGLVYSDGLETGFMKGYALGLEIGFYEEVASKSFVDANAPINSSPAATASLDVNQEPQSDHTAEPSIDTGIESNKCDVPVSERVNRVQKRLQIIAKKASTVPTHNDENFDFDSHLLEMRAAYKSCAHPAGLFLAKSVGIQNQPQTGDDSMSNSNSILREESKSTSW